jgi:Protease inhibitor Inh
VSKLDMRRGAIIAAAIAASLCGGAALAQNAQQDTQGAPDTQQQNPQSSGDPVAAVVGAWELSNADHDKICRLNFRADPTANGHKIDVDKNCPNAFPSTKDIAAWAVDNYGSLRLLNAQGDAVIELTEVEGGMYDGFTPEEGRYILQAAAAAAAAAVRTADDMAGDWAVARSTGKPICTLTLANSPAAAGGDTLALKLKPGCDALIVRFGPTSWRMDNGELILQAPRGQSWRFEENDANTWQRLPESADPILLVRQ